MTNVQKRALLCGFGKIALPLSVVLVLVREIHLFFCADCHPLCEDMAEVALPLSVVSGACVLVTDSGPGGHCVRCFGDFVVVLDMTFLRHIWRL